MMRPIAAALWYRVGCFVFAGGTHRRGLCGWRWTGDTAWRRVSPARRALPAATDEDRMRDQRIVTLMILIFILNVGHTIDHVARGAVRWPLTADSVAFIVVSAIIYALIGLVLYLYWYGKVGPRFIAIVAALGTAFGWFGHFSPFHRPAATAHSPCLPVDGGRLAGGGMADRADAGAHRHDGLRHKALASAAAGAGRRGIAGQKKEPAKRPRASWPRFANAVSGLQRAPARCRRPRRPPSRNRRAAPDCRPGSCAEWRHRPSTWRAG